MRIYANKEQYHVVLHSRELGVGGVHRDKVIEQMREPVKNLGITFDVWEKNQTKLLFIVDRSIADSVNSRQIQDRELAKFFNSVTRFKPTVIESESGFGDNLMSSGK